MAGKGKGMAELPGVTVAKPGAAMALTTREAAAVVEDKATQAGQDGQGIALNFRVTPELKRGFKVAAAQAGITQSALLAEAFELWMREKRTSGGT